MLTSNRTRELHDALKRRCLYHWIDYPDPEREREIVRARLPDVPDEIAARVVEAVGQAARPGRPLQAAGRGGDDRVGAGAAARSAARSTLEDTLGAVLKVHEDCCACASAGSWRACRGMSGGGAAG